MTDRRDFLRRSVAAGVGAAAGLATSRELAGAPAVLSAQVAPTAIASANGLEAVELAFGRVADGGSTLDAVVEGVNIVERNPDDMSVGVRRNSRIWTGLFSSTPRSCTVRAGARARLRAWRA